jgi:plasmid maintenance system antidote protein VapI
MNNNKKQSLENIVTTENSGWLAKALWAKVNKKWLNRSSGVSLSVLEALREKEWSQKKLAQEMKVSSQQINKILKGQQNLTFETVSKLEDALGVTLMEIIPFRRENAKQIIQAKSLREEVSKPTKQQIQPVINVGNKATLKIAYNRNASVQYKNAG